MIKSISFLYKFILISLFLIGISIPSTYSQATSKLTWTTDSEFLPQNSIKSIVPDKYGFIWMTTENGLVRYDGKNFAIFDSHNTGIKSNRLIYIIGDYQADSLYTTNDWDEQYIFIHKRKVQVVDKKTHPNAVQFEKNDKNGRFTASGVPSPLFDVPKRPYHIPLASKNYYHIDNNTIRFFSSKKKLLYKLNFEYESNKNFFTIGDVLFYLEKSGRYAIIKNGNIKWNKLNVNPKSANDLYWNTVSKQTFIFSERRLYKLDYNSKGLEKSALIEGEDLDINRINSIYFDENNKIVYLGSRTKGLGIYKIKNFKTIAPSETDTSEIFYAMLPFENNTIISASGIVMNNNGIVKNLNFVSDNYIMTFDRNKNIWTAKGSKLICYKKDGDYKQTTQWELGSEITSLFTDQKGQIWYSLAFERKNLGILYNFNPSENPVFKKYMELDFNPKFLTQNTASTLLIASNKGLYKLDLNYKKVVPIKGTEGLKVRNVFISSRENTWISTYENGFLLIKNEKVYTFPMDTNDYLLSSHCIAEDKKGFLWISTNKGLFQVKEKSLLAYADKKISNVYYQYYNKESGFLTNEFNGGCQPCSVKNVSNIFLPSINGVVTFNPDHIRPILPNNRIFIDEALVDNKRLSINDTLHLNRKFGRVTFFITSPYYGNSNNLNFEARLEGGSSTEWTKISKENNISFTSLSPGEYHLVVRKLSGFDANYEYKKIAIIIEPAFWETLWFKMIILALVVLIGIAFYNLRIQFITNNSALLEKKINEQTNDLKNTISTLRATKQNLNQQIENNTKIIQYITHDIKSPLKFMAMASKYMYDSFEENDPDLKENIQSIFTSSSQMFNFVDNLLEYSKVYLDKGELYIEEFKLHEVINEKIALFESIANSKKITIKNLIEKNTTLKGNKQLFSIIIHNLLDNAIKNTPYGNIIFNALVDEEQTYISIADTGNGMDKSIIDYYQDLIDNYDSERSKTNKRIGLHIVIELLLILNGKMNIESSNNKGTVITLTFNNNA